MPAWVKPLLISLATSYAGNRIAAEAQNEATRRRLATEARLREDRTRKANQELAQKFQTATQGIGPENEQALLQAEDAKNLKTFDDTEQNAEVKIGQGLNLGGKELAEYTNLKEAQNAEGAKRNRARKIFHSQFLSPNIVQSQRGNYADELALGRSRLADELAGQKIGDDLEVAAIRPNAGMLALADAIKIGGQVYGMYNLANAPATMGSTTTKIPLSDAMKEFGATAGSGGSATSGSLSQAFGNAGGAGVGFAPANAYGMWPKPTTPAWPASGGGWFGG